MHICPDEFKAAVAVVSGIYLVPHYCRWCWYKIKAFMARKEQRQQLQLPPAQVHEPERYPLQWRE